MSVHVYLYLYYFKVGKFYLFKQIDLCMLTYCILDILNALANFEDKCYKLHVEQLNRNLKIDLNTAGAGNDIHT